MSKQIFKTEVCYFVHITELTHALFDHRSTK